MTGQTDHDQIARKLRDLDGVQAALKLAVRRALREHALAGNPVAVWRDNRVVWIVPKVEDFPKEGPQS